ncbi:MAG: nucleotidyltransferase domain-containing protein [Candidatus Zapsychrus exili]|nr:nucleotidyltransferase domain-containing protein [Candidatus Zapsychrus exili]
MDIFKLTKSKTREKLLQLFFSDPSKKYYLRELERILNISVGNIRRELLFLEKTGLFKCEKMGKQVYYFLNKDSALFEDFKNIVFKTIGVQGRLKKELEKIKGIKQAFIFGSFAKNKENTSSDIDLMIIGKIDEDLLISKISKLENLFKREINYHLIDEEEWKEKSKKDSFLKNIIHSPKIKII